MTLEDIKKSPAPMLTPAQVAAVMHLNPHSIRILAAQDKLPFPFIRSGNRTHIPREGFIKWMEGSRND